MVPLITAYICTVRVAASVMATLIFFYSKSGISKWWRHISDRYFVLIFIYVMILVRENSKSQQSSIPYD